MLLALCPPAGEWRWAEKAVLPADSAGTHLVGAETGEAAVRQRQKNITAGAVHRQPACARHGGAAEYPHVCRLSEVLV